MYMYIVTALHNTGHGPLTSVVLVTEDPKKALDTARLTQHMAYEFFLDSDHGITVSRVLPEITYDHQPGDSSRPHGTPTNEDAMVYARFLDRDWSKDPPEPCWREVFMGEWKKIHP
jgi:hypothetical protein